MARSLRSVVSSEDHTAADERAACSVRPMVGMPALPSFGLVLLVVTQLTVLKPTALAAAFRLALADSSNAGV